MLKPEDVEASLQYTANILAKTLFLPSRLREEGHRLCLRFEDTLQRFIHTRNSSKFLPFNATNYSPKFCGLLKRINTQFYIHRVLLFISLMECFFFLPVLLIHQENFIDKNNSSFSQQFIHLQNGFQFVLQTIENFLLYFLVNLNLIQKYIFYILMQDFGS